MASVSACAYSLALLSQKCGGVTFADKLNEPSSSVYPSAHAASSINDRSCSKILILAFGIPILPRLNFPLK